jgi:hypothetical protein
VGMTAVVVATVVMIAGAVMLHLERTSTTF